MKSNIDIKQEARESLSGKWGTAALVTLILGIIYIVCNSNSRTSRLLPAETLIITSVLSIVGFFIIGALYLGYTTFILNAIRNKDIEVGQLFSGFKNFWKAFLANLLRSLIVFVWALLVIIPIVGGIIYFAIDFKLAFSNINAMSEDYFSTFLNNISGGAILLWILLIILFLVPAIIAGIDYALTFFVLSDNPNIDALSALEESKKLIKGHRWKLWLLGLSFMGWIILCILTLGLGLLLLIPYIYASYAKFYEERKAELYPEVEAESAEIL